MPGDHSKLAPLLPIPNRTVKRLSADDSADSRVKVGHRQALTARNAQLSDWAFSLPFSSCSYQRAVLKWKESVKCVLHQKIGATIQGFADCSEVNLKKFLQDIFNKIQPISVGVWRRIAKFFGTKKSNAHGNKKWSSLQFRFYEWVARL